MRALSGLNQRRSLARLRQPYLRSSLQHPVVVDDCARDCLTLVSDRSPSGCTGVRELTILEGHALQAANSGQRQHHRADLVSNPAPVTGATGRVALHRSRQAKGNVKKGDGTDQL